MVNFTFHEEVPIGAENRALVLIPARYASSRFPGKPLAKIAGKSMIEWVFTHCSEANALAGQSTPKFEVVVVTDDERIESEVKRFKGRVVRVDDDVPSGTERIHLAFERFFSQDSFDLVINVQGDEPLLAADDLAQLAQEHLQSPYDLYTMVKKQDDLELIDDPNIVKAIWDAGSRRCHYFSRSPIPYDRDGTRKHWYSHVGVYSFRPKSLRKFCSRPPSEYELLESLEQLRALQAGMTIGATETDKKLIGVDTPDDMTKLDGVLK